jgi:hypothetical protein
MANSPILANSCALAATAAEARYRIDARPQTPRATSVVALDDGAMAVVRELAGQEWNAARFLGCTEDAGAAGEYADLELRTVAGEPVRLSTELAEADFVMMIATEGRGAAAAATIGDACTLRGIMTAGLVVGSDVGSAGGSDGGSAGGSAAALTALRPNARVLLVTGDERDATELLAAVGA